MSANERKSALVGSNIISCCEIDAVFANLYYFRQLIRVTQRQAVHSFQAICSFECQIYIMQREEENNLIRRHPANYQQELLLVRRGDSGEKLMQEEAEEERQRDSQQDVQRSEIDKQEGESQADCFGDCLSSLGCLCIPFQICCHCQQCCSYACQSFPLYQQQTGTTGLLQEWGGFSHLLPAGLHILNPISQSVVTVSLQTKTLEFSQVVSSKDNIQMQLKMVVFYRVADGVKFTYKLGSSAQDCIVSMTTAGMRGLLGQNLFQVVVENPAKLTQQLKREANHQLQHWGIYVEMISVKDLLISEELALSMEQVAMQRRTNESMLIDFQADVEVGKLIKEMAEIMDTSSAFQIRYLKAIEHIIENGSENIVVLRANPNQGKWEY